MVPPHAIPSTIIGRTSPQAPHVIAPLGERPDGAVAVLAPAVLPRWSC